VPKRERLEALARDYASMQIMLFGKAPPFDTIISALAELEAEINNPVKPMPG
jgi:hypothetical protein